MTADILQFKAVDLKETRVLVTGNKGFIGRHLVQALLARGVKELHTLDRAHDPSEDILTADFPNVDFCFHLAAETNAQSGDYMAMDLVNRKGTERLLCYYGDRLIFASTCAINYPGTPYADSKLEAERMCRVHRARVVRLCNIFGPGGHGVIDCFAGSDVLRVRGSGTQLRTYAHVNHAVIALIRQLNKPPGNLYVLPGMNATVMELTHLWLDKPVVRVPRHPLDLEHAPQVYPLATPAD